jgi:peptidoglycan/xylan/chitin deacetylase (PgdA/CDA1 family)
MSLVGRILWYVPGRFDIVRIFGHRYSLRCVLFHDISDAESNFTKGLGGTISRKNFEAALKFLTRHYTPVNLQAVLDDFDGRRLPPRPVLVTFDDGYKSVSEVAAPLCSQFGIPAMLFVNATCLNNRQLALDNLICYVANVFGLNTINAAIRTVAGTKDLEVRSLAEVFSRFFPLISLPDRKAFRNALVDLARIDENSLAAEASLYLSDQQLCDLAGFNFEIGDHTYSHVNCRSLVAEELAEEIDQNRSVLEAISGRKVRSFSVPYGHSADLTSKLSTHLKESGYEAIFLAEGRANSPRTHRLRLDRVSVKASTDATLFSEIELLPRVRAIRNRPLSSSNFASNTRNSLLEKTEPPADLLA